MEQHAGRHCDDYTPTALRLWHKQTRDHANTGTHSPCSEPFHASWYSLKVLPPVWDYLCMHAKTAQPLSPLLFTDPAFSPACMHVCLAAAMLWVSAAAVSTQPKNTQSHTCGCCAAWTRLFSGTRAVRRKACMPAILKVQKTLRCPSLENSWCWHASFHHSLELTNQYMLTHAARKHTAVHEASSTCSTVGLIQASHSCHSQQPTAMQACVKRKLPPDGPGKEDPQESTATIHCCAYIAAML